MLEPSWSNSDGSIRNTHLKFLNKNKSVTSQAGANSTQHVLNFRNVQKNSQLFPLTEDWWVTLEVNIADKESFDNRKAF